MRALRSLSLAAALCLPCLAGGPERAGTPELKFEVTDGGEHFRYSIAHPESVRAARIEVLDLPHVLATRAVPIQASGELEWEWKWENAAFLRQEEDEDRLQLALWDPDGISLICEGTTMSVYPGGEVSATTAGGRTGFDAEPSLESSLVRVLQGSTGFQFVVTGSNLTSKATFHVFSEKAAKCEDRFIHARTLDLAHAEVTVDRECLQEPGILFVSASDKPASYDTDRVWIHVAVRNSPELTSVSPMQVRENLPPAKLKLVLRGTNFTKDSTVDADYNPDGLDYNEVSQLNLDTEYVSATELRATVHTDIGDDSLIRTLGWNRTGFRIWVEGNADRFELSEPRDIRVLRRDGRRRRLPAVISSISPFPIPLMDEHSPEELEITIHGEGFVPANKVKAGFGTLSSDLRTQYLSPTTLRAWLPRKYWRKHHIVCRLVVETTAGRSYSQQVEPEVDQ